MQILYIKTMKKINGNSNILFKTYITEKELIKIFQFHYNDIFSLFLSHSQLYILNNLKKQVQLNLQIINKSATQQSFLKIQEIFQKKYLTDKQKIQNAYNIIKNKQNNEIEFLDKLNCYIHCPSCSGAYHTCGKKFILSLDMVFCLSCMKVYNEKQVNLYCDFCNIEYFSKLREITNYNYANFFQVSISKYHCKIDNEIKIKCPYCQRELYVDISNPMNFGRDISEIECIKCNTFFKVNKFSYKCKNCEKFFKSKAKIFNEFNYSKNDILNIVHSIIKGKFASPEFIVNRECNCDLKNIKKFKHFDGGTLYQDENKKNILCDKCFNIFDYKSFQWNCPICNCNINKLNNRPLHKNHSETKIDFRKTNYIKSAIENNSNNKINFNNKLYNDRYKGVLSCSNEKKEKKIFNNKNNDYKFHNITLGSKFVKINIPSPKETEKNINIKYQTFYNNYAPLINFGDDRPTSFSSGGERKISKSILKNNNISLGNLPRNHSLIFSKPNKNIFVKGNILKRNETEFTRNYQMKIIEYQKNSKMEKSNNINKKNKNNNYPLTNLKFGFNNEKNIKINKNNNDNLLTKSSSLKQNSLNLHKISRNSNNKVDTIQEVNEEKLTQIKLPCALSGRIQLKRKMDFTSGKKKKNLKSNNTLSKIDFQKNKKSGKKSIKKANTNIKTPNKNCLPQHLIINSEHKNNKSEKIIQVKSMRKSNISSKSNNKKPKIEEFNSEDYNILKIIGEGTFGQIFLVENNKTHYKYALKKITANQKTELEISKQEFDLLMKLSQENEKLHLVKIYGVQIKQLDKFNLVLYVLMEAAISDWEKEIQNRNRINKYYTEKELLKILKNLVYTFANLQQKGICHRDVKPQNILYFPENLYKITDFGEAKAILKKGFRFQKDTSLQTVRGTELYMSPILFHALHQKPVLDLQYNAYKSDVFSLGLCILLAATLEYKVLYDIREIANMDIMASIIRDTLDSFYSEKFIDILIKMLQIEEKYRPDFIELEAIIKCEYK